MPNLYQLGFTDYTTYINSPHFERCRKLVKGKPCFINEILSSILPHHTNYKNLGCERLYRDIYPICFDCHTAIHFIVVQFPLGYQLKLKVPLNRFCLTKRMLYLRLKYLLQQKRGALAMWYAFRFVLPVY